MTEMDRKRCPLTLGNGTSAASRQRTRSSLLGTSATVTSSSLELQLYRFLFASAVLLEAGKTYLLAAVNASGTSTAVNRLAVISRSGSSGWDLNAPGETAWRTPQLDSIGVGVRDREVLHRGGGSNSLKPTRLGPSR